MILKHEVEPAREAKLGVSGAVRGDPASQELSKAAGVRRGPWGLAPTVAVIS